MNTKFDFIDDLDIDGIIDANMTVHDRLLRDAIHGVVIAALTEAADRIEMLEKITGDMADAAIEVHDAVAAEREACARVCETQRDARIETHPARVEFSNNAVALRCAAAIRARGEGK